MRGERHTGLKARMAQRGALAAALICAGLIAGRATAPTRSIPRAPEAASPQAAVQDKRSTPTPRGAVRAATEFLDALRWNVLVDDRHRRRVIARFAAPALADELQVHLSRGVRDLRAAVSARPVVARRAFLGYRVNRYSKRRASVAVWGMAVFGSSSYEPVSQWATSTLDLVWRSDGWRVAEMRSAPGPSPQWSVEELAVRVSGFREFRNVP